MKFTYVMIDGIRVKSIDIYVDGGSMYVTVARESDEQDLIDSVADIYIYGYVPDDVFKKSDEEIAEYVEEYLT